MPDLMTALTFRIALPTLPELSTVRAEPPAFTVTVTDDPSRDMVWEAA